MSHEKGPEIVPGDGDEDRLFPIGHESTGEELTDAALRQFAQEYLASPHDAELESAESIRAQFILRESYDHFSRAVKKQQLEDDKFFKIDGRVRVDGKKDPSYYNVILLTPDGLLPPLEEPDSMVQLVIRFRDMDVIEVIDAEGNVSYSLSSCLLEHRRPTFRKSSPRVSRFAITKLGISRWVTDAAKNPKPIKEALKTLDSFTFMVENFRLVPQRSPQYNADGSPTSITRPTIDSETERILLGEFGVQDFEEKEETKIDNLEQLKELVADAFIDAFSRLSDQTLQDSNKYSFVRYSENRETVAVFLAGRKTDPAMDKSGVLLTVKNVFEPFVEKWETTEIYGETPQGRIVEQHISIPEDVIERALEDITIEYQGALGNIFNTWSISPGSVVNSPSMGHLRNRNSTEEPLVIEDAAAANMIYRALVRYLEELILTPIPK